MDSDPVAVRSTKISPSPVDDETMLLLFGCEVDVTSAFTGVDPGGASQGDRCTVGGQRGLELDVPVGALLGGDASGEIRDCRSVGPTKNETRECRLKRPTEAMGENTKAGAIDRALKHYLAERQNKKDVVDELPGEIVQALSTPQLPIERETVVGTDAE